MNYPKWPLTYDGENHKDAPEVNVATATMAQHEAEVKKAKQNILDLFQGTCVAFYGLPRQGLLELAANSQDLKQVRARFIDQVIGYGARYKARLDETVTVIVVNRQLYEQVLNKTTENADIQQALERGDVFIVDYEFLVSGHPRDVLVHPQIYYNEGDIPEDITKPAVYRPMMSNPALGGKFKLLKNRLPFADAKPYKEIKAKPTRLIQQNIKSGYMTIGDLASVKDNDNSRDIRVVPGIWYYGVVDDKIMAYHHSQASAKYQFLESIGDIYSISGNFAIMDSDYAPRNQRQARMLLHLIGLSLPEKFGNTIDEQKKQFKELEKNGILISYDLKEKQETPTWSQWFKSWAVDLPKVYTETLMFMFSEYLVFIRANSYNSIQEGSIGPIKVSRDDKDRIQYIEIPLKTKLNEVWQMIERVQSADEPSKVDVAKAVASAILRIRK